jgi:hypothetical protein
MKHEKSTLEEITALRSQAMKSGVSSDQMAGIDNKLSSPEFLTFKNEDTKVP